MFNDAMEINLRQRQYQYATEALEAMGYPYPESAKLREALKHAKDYEDLKSAFLRSWWSESVPYVFLKHPLAYEQLRNWISSTLQDICALDAHPNKTPKIPARMVGIIGSGRFGYTIVDRKGYGRMFLPKSDIDAFVVSDHLFCKIEVDALKWIEDYAHNLVRPKNEREGTFWEENSKIIPGSQLPNGFIDTEKIPSKLEYKMTQKVLNALSRASRDFSPFTYDENTHRIRLRVYRSIDYLDKQLSKNLDRLIGAYYNNDACGER